MHTCMMLAVQQIKATFEIGVDYNAMHYHAIVQPHEAIGDATR